MIDLHTHTIYSDGSSSVKELLEEAERKKISLLAITDHNTIAAYKEVDSLQYLFSGRILPGVEITTTYNGEVIEVLGYGFDIGKMRDFLDKYVLTFEEKQLKEFELIKRRYKEIGVRFDEENIIFDPKTESSRVAFVNEIKRYPENYKFFLNSESINTNSGFTRNEVYNPKSSLYVDQSSLFPSLNKTIEIIHRSGGLAFLAHVYAYSPTIAKDLVPILDTYDLDGVECFYTIFTDEQSKYLINLCRERGLYMSGGSDFHGSRKVNHNLGVGRGNLFIEENLIQEWINIIDKSDGLDDEPKVFVKSE